MMRSLQRRAKFVAADFNIVSSEFHANPIPTLNAMRASGPLVPMKLPIVGRMLLAVTHDACSSLLKDHDTFARDPLNAGIKTQQRILKMLPRTIGLLALNMLGHDDPEHRRLRGLVDQAFQRRAVQASRPMIERVAERLLDRIEGKPNVDLLAEFCRDLPLSVICELLGLPERDHDRFKNWLGGLKDTANIAAVIRTIPGVIRVVSYLRRVSRPGGGALPGGLIVALEESIAEGEVLSEDELVSMIFLLFGAGQETTTHLLAGGIAALLLHPQQRDRLQGDPDLVNLCGEECLRWVSPVQMTKPRFAKHDLFWQGFRLHKGDMLAGFLAAANFDPAKFENAHQFDIARHPNPHLSFGTGVHFCLGFQLARLEVAIAIERIFTRFPSIQLAIPADELHWHKRLGIRSLSTLPVRLLA